MGEITPQNREGHERLDTSPSSATARLARARLSLEGLSVGDAYGQRFPLHLAVVKGLLPSRSLPPPPWRYTDDTEMALSLVAVLRDKGAALRRAT